MCLAQCAERNGLNISRFELFRLISYPCVSCSVAGSAACRDILASESIQREALHWTQPKTPHQLNVKGKSATKCNCQGLVADSTTIDDSIVAATPCRRALCLCHDTLQKAHFSRYPLPFRRNNKQRKRDRIVTLIGILVPANGVQCGSQIGIPSQGSRKRGGNSSGSVNHM